MKTLLRITALCIVVAAGATLASAQETNSTGQADAAAGLRSQLGEVQAKEADLQARERQLDEDLRPENIELALAGVGSTKPEELREQRRRQLESEKARVHAQLDQLAQSRTRLEAAIQRADAEAYRRSAQVDYQASQPQPVAQDTKKVSAPQPQPRRSQRRRRARRH